MSMTSSVTDIWRSSVSGARYLAGYLLRTGTPALTRSRWSRNPAVTEPPTKDRMPMFRLEDRTLEKLLAMFGSGSAGTDGRTGGRDSR